MTDARRPGRPKGGGRSAAESRELLLDAAEACFSRFGLDKTTVDDIAAEAGMSRSMVYRVVDGRDDLLDGVLARLTERYIAHLAAQLDPDASLADVLVDAIGDVVALARTDPTVAAMFVGGDRATAGSAVAGSSQIRQRARSFAREVLATAGDARMAQLRPGLDVDAAVDHVLLTGLALIQGYGPTEPDEVRTYLRTFLVPALVA